MKGNPGASWHQKAVLAKKMLPLPLLILIFLGIPAITTISNISATAGDHLTGATAPSSSSSANYHHYKDDDERYAWAVKAVGMAKKNENFRALLEGRMELISISLNQTALDMKMKDAASVAAGDYEGGADGTFCKVDMSVQKKDPSQGVYYCVGRFRLCLRLFVIGNIFSLCCDLSVLSCVFQGHG
jgi:hypothetical protein